MARLRPVPLTQREAFAFIRTHHRHHKPPVGDIFRVAVACGEELVGVATVGRPVARRFDDGTTAEVTRCCVRDDLPEAKHAASKLYAMAWRIARELGYIRLITYTLEREKGISLTAAGWKTLYQTAGGRWSRSSRPRTDQHPLEKKTLWQVSA